MNIPENRYFGVIVAPHQAEMHCEPLGQMGPEDLLLKMETNNICTTDYQQWMGLRNHQGFPMASGHEWSGIIVEKGEKTLNTLQVGDRVALAELGCGVCESCHSGFTNECKQSGRSYDGVYHGDRGCSNYRIIHQGRVLPMSKEISAAEAGFLEPVSTVVAGVHKARVSHGETVVVVGAGTMGLVNAQVAKAHGARVIITEISDKKRKRAEEMGIAEVIDAKRMDPVQAVMDLTRQKGADVVIPAVGNTIAYQQAYGMLKKNRARLLLFAAGYPAPELVISPNEVHYRRMEILGTSTSTAADYLEAAQLISNKQVDCRYSLEGEVFALRDIQAAYEAAATPDTYRITLDLQGI